MTTVEQLNAADEKRRRVYFENLVYEVCHLLNIATGRSVRYDTQVIAGSADKPSNDVPATLQNLIEELGRLRRHGAEVRPAPDRAISGVGVATVTPAAGG
jgi:hypothetical protein